MAEWLILGLELVKYKMSRSFWSHCITRKCEGRGVEHVRRIQEERERGRLVSSTSTHHVWTCTLQPESTPESPTRSNSGITPSSTCRCPGRSLVYPRGWGARMPGPLQGREGTRRPGRRRVKPCSLLGLPPKTRNPRLITRRRPADPSTGAPTERPRGSSTRQERGKQEREAARVPRGRGGRAGRGTGSGDGRGASAGNLVRPRLRLSPRRWATETFSAGTEVPATHPRGSVGTPASSLPPGCKPKTIPNKKL